MGKVKASDIVMMVLGEAESQFQSQYVPKSRMEKLKENLDVIDRLSDEFDCFAAEAEVDEDTLNLLVTLVCSDMILENGRSHEFFELIKSVKCFYFAAEEDNLRVTFEFAGLWENRD